MLFNNPTFSSPIHKLYETALAATDLPIIEEYSMEHVISVFHNHLAEHSEYELLPNSKFGVLLLQCVSSDEYQPEFCFFQPENGLELCYYILDDMMHDVFIEIMKPLLPYIGSHLIEIPCSSEQEKVLRDALSPILNQFPLTQDVLFDSVINYPQRLYF